MFNKDRQNLIHSKHHYALLMTTIEGEALAHITCAEGMKTIFDYTKPIDPKADMTTTTRRVGERKKVEFYSINKTDLFSDPIQLLDNGRCINTKWLFKKKQNINGHAERCRARLFAKSFAQIF